MTQDLRQLPRSQRALLPQAEGRRADDALYDMLRRNILTLVLRPGQRVTEQAVATQYGAGKAAVRRALLRLVQDGLIESRARSGHYVSTITMRDMHELYAVRKMLLPQAGALAATRDCSALEAPYKAVMRTQFSPDDPETILRYCLANRAFTGAIAAASGNTLLAELASEIEDRAVRVMVLNSMGMPRLDVLHRQIKDIYEGICSGDAERSRKILMDVLEDSEMAAMEAVMHLPMLQLINLGN